MELKITNLSMEFGSLKAVDSISCSLTGGVYGLLGVNGAGKTTLMRMLTTLMRPSSGCITWDGQDIFALGGEYRKLLGYLPQEYGFYPEFSVMDYLLYIASIKGLRPSVARRRAGLLLKQVGLYGERERKMKTLSGGMKRRAGIAQAMLNDPRILILDEPTAGLDPSERVRFRNLISEMSEDRIVLLSTHIVSDIEYIAGNIFLMKNGSFLRTGSAQDIIASMPQRVWRTVVPKSQIDSFLSTFQVCNIRTVPGGAEIRVLSAEPPAEGSVEQAATLEDAFLCYFGQKGGIPDGAL